MNGKRQLTDGGLKMATATQIKKFIDEIAPIIQKYAKLYGYKVASPIIAQACIESAYGTSSLGYKYHNYFGMKCGSSWTGRSVNLSTKEEYKAGTLTSIKANFRVYDSMDAGVKGYFEFISAKRYLNLKTATTAEDYLQKIKADGYATSSTYVNTNMSCVTKYSLTAYDNFGVESKVESEAESGSGATTSTVYFAKYTGNSHGIVDALHSIGITDASIAARKKIAAINGINDYTGTATQNTKLLQLLKEGKLIKP